jgi:hypothetical protein
MSAIHQVSVCMSPATIKQCSKRDQKRATQNYNVVSHDAVPVVEPSWAELIANLANASASANSGNLCQVSRAVSIPGEYIDLD